MSAEKMIVWLGFGIGGGMALAILLIPITLVVVVIYSFMFSFLDIEEPLMKVAYILASTIYAIAILFFGFQILKNGGSDGRQQ